MTNVITALVLIFGVSAAHAGPTNQKSQNIDLLITEKGFEPKQIDVKPGTDVTLKVTRKTDQTCSTEVQIPSKGIKKTTLPLNKPVTIALGTLEKGEIRFDCGMDMMDSGRINVR